MPAGSKFGGSHPPTTGTTSIRPARWSSQLLTSWSCLWRSQHSSEGHQAEWPIWPRSTFLSRHASKRCGPTAR
jgi:hypothetical protein